MSSTATPTRGRRGRRAPQEGPRASLKQLLPFLLEHRRVLVIVVILSIVGAIATLAQPLLVGLLISRVQAGEPLGMLVWGVFALVVAASVISGFQHFLLQRTGTAVVYSSRRKLIGAHPAPADQRVRRAANRRSRLAGRHRHDAAVRRAHPGSRRCRRKQPGLRRRPRGDGAHRPRAAGSHRPRDRSVDRGRDAAQRTDPHGNARPAGEGGRARVGRGASRRIDPHRARGRRRRPRGGRDLRAGRGGLRPGCADRQGVGAHRADRGDRAAAVAAGRARCRRPPGRLRRDHRSPRSSPSSCSCSC